jgi:uncharacterized membrane protein
LLATMTKRLILGMLLASTLFSTAFLYAEAGLVISGVAGLAVLALGVALWWSFRQKKGVGAKPQFTRQSMRERDGGNVGAMGLPDDGEDG